MNEMPVAYIQLGVFAMQDYGLFEDHHVRLGHGKQGELQAGGQGEGSSGAAEKRGVEGSEGDRPTGSHSAGSQHQSAQLVRLSSQKFTTRIFFISLQA